MPSDLKLTAEQIGELERLEARSRNESLAPIDRVATFGALRELYMKRGPALIAAAKRDAEPRCPECNGELSSCGTATIDGPSLDCRACLLNDLLRAMEARSTSAEQRAVEAEERVARLEKWNDTLVRVLERLQYATAEQQHTLTSLGWKTEANGMKWSLAGARWHQYQEVSGAEIDARYILDEHALGHDAPDPLPEHANIARTALAQPPESKETS